MSTERDVTGLHRRSRRGRVTTRSVRLVVSGVCVSALVACGGVGEPTGVDEAMPPTSVTMASHTGTAEAAATTTTAFESSTTTGAPDTTSTTLANAPTTSTNGERLGSTTTGSPEPQNPLVTEAVTDLSARLGIDEADITVVRVEEVEWPDASLGCPDPRKSYAQVLVDGYDIVLSAGGAEHHYHGGGGTGPFYCAIPTS